MIKAGEISEIIKRQLAGYEAEVNLQEVGRVIEVGDGIARIYGLEKSMSGELLSFPGDVVGMVLNLEQDNVGAVLLGEDTLIKEGDKERVQIFEGVVIDRRSGGSRASFTVRKISYGVGVERIFPLHTSRIEKIEVVQKGRVRRARLNYLRELQGRAARIEVDRSQDDGAEGAAPARAAKTSAVPAAAEAKPSAAIEAKLAAAEAKPSAVEAKTEGTA